MGLPGAVFIGVSLACGLAYWWHADWWAYYDKGHGPEPKFPMPWWWQVIESGIVGAAAGLPAAGVAWVVRRAQRRPPAG
jgi:hypothetical protein